MIKITPGGSTKKLDAFLDRILADDIFPSSLESKAQRGVEALRQNTPVDSGVTADSWEYEIVRDKGQITIWWRNTHVEDGFHVAIGLQYGHGTGSGGWVQGYDFINPALKPIFDDIANATWEEVQRA